MPSSVPPVLRLVRPLPALLALSVYLVLVAGPTGGSAIEVDADVDTGLVTTYDGR